MKVVGVPEVKAEIERLVGQRDAARLNLSVADAAVESLSAQLAAADRLAEVLEGSADVGALSGPELDALGAFRAARVGGDQ